jgi:hypothetical protein
MSMYVEILSSALDEWEHELTESRLIDHVLACREEMLRPGVHNGPTAYVTVASQIAYDRALIALCRAYGAKVSVADFTNPGTERSRLEQKLRAAGLDLANLACRRRRAKSGRAPNVQEGRT